MKTNVHGNLEGLRESYIRKLEELYNYDAEDAFLPRELMQTMADFSCEMNRELALYLTRDGEVVEVCVGTDRDVSLRDFRLRRSERRLSCVRCIHTHPNGDGRLSDVDLSALRAFRYDAMVAVGCKDGDPTWVQCAFLDGELNPQLEQPVRWYQVPEEAWSAQVLACDALIDAAQPPERAQQAERAVLMGIESEDSLAELARLAETAGAQVVGRFLQKRDKPDTATFIGSGRAEELARQCQALEADLCIFDEELNGIQQKNLEEILQVKVVDRTTLILDIFAQRASSAEGKLQVELAQLQYRASRLLGQGVSLSRLAGGIGTRGPGESKLEISRRRIRERTADLRRRLSALEQQRDLRRKSRERSEIPVVALVGYTNSGKSTLLNALTGADVYAEDQLFATLDTVSRRMETAEHTPYLLVDTVGFIRKLPHTLVSAFHSTLEEAVLADVLVIVSDGASPEILQQHETVEQVLQELGATDQPRIEAINKCDLPGVEPVIPGCILISARTGEGLPELERQIADALQKTHRQVTFFLPFSNYGLLSQIRPLGRVVQEEYTDDGLRLTMVMDQRDVERLVHQYGREILV